MSRRNKVESELAYRGLRVFADSDYGMYRRLTKKGKRTLPELVEQMRGDGELAARVAVRASELSIAYRAKAVALLRRAADVPLRRDPATTTLSSKKRTAIANDLASEGLWCLDASESTRLLFDLVFRSFMGFSVCLYEHRRVD